MLALYDHWLSQGKQPRWQPLAVSTPNKPATLFYCTCSLLCSGIGWFQPWWGMAFSLLLWAAMLSEWSGIFRLSQLFFSPRGSGFLSLSGGNVASSSTFLLCVGVDTQNADLTYHPEPFARWLRPLHWQSITPATLLLALTACSLAIHILLFWYPNTLIRTVFLVFLSLEGGLWLLLWWTSNTPTNEEASIRAIAVACKTAERLEVLGDKFPCRWELLLLGASTQGWAMESWIRQHQHLYHPEHTYVLEIAPTSSQADILYYRTHEGILRTISMNTHWITAAESVATRFQQKHKLSHAPVPQRRFGAGLSWVAHQHGYPAVTLGAACNTAGSSPPSSSVPLTEDTLSDWCVAVVSQLSPSLSSSSSFSVEVTPQKSLHRV